MEITKRIGQKEDETAMEYLRRLVSNCNYEAETLLGKLPNVEAICEFFDLWKIYDTDFWEGCMEQIACGDSATPAIAFCKKYKLKDFLLDIEAAKQARVESVSA